MKRLTTVDRSERLFVNPRNRDLQVRSTRDAQAFHRRLPGYEPSPLHRAPGIARSLGLAELWVKDESSRFGLPAFKIMGASWAIYNAARAALRERTGAEIGPWADLDDLAAALSPLRPLTLTCATDGNHGRAVARMAKLLGFSARIIVPDDMAQARIDAIAGEGAEIVVHHGSYDEAVARSSAEATPDDLVISDTSWPGYTEIPGWVIEGYSTIMWEVTDELSDRGEPFPDLIAVQIGVGAFAAAVIGHVRATQHDPHPFILAVEPAKAACALASMEAGEIVEVPGPHDSIMSGLNCGVPSPMAWPVVLGGADAFIGIDDERARDGMRRLYREGIIAGECGGAGLGGIVAWAERFGGEIAGKRALIISTEGATDPVAYAAIVGA